MKTKKVLLVVLLLIILIAFVFLMTCFTKKIKAEDNNNISIMFYKKVLNEYLALGSLYTDVYMNTDNFINLSTQEKLSDESIQEIIDSVQNDRIKFTQQGDEMNNYKLVIKFLNYDIESLAFRIYFYNGDSASQIATYEASYKNDEWEINLIIIGAT